MIQDLINFSNTNQFLFLEANKESFFFFFFSMNYNNNSNRKISKFSVEGKERKAVNCEIVNKHLLYICINKPLSKFVENATDEI